MPTGNIVDATPLQQTLQFLQDLFGFCPPDLFVYLWTSSDKRSHWFKIKDLEAMATWAQRLKETSNVYVGVALSPQSFGESRRCPTEKVAGIVGSWGDVDIASPAHKKANLPPTFNDAIELCNSILMATLIISSGHGLQPWHLFKEPWIFENDADRVKAMAFAQGWQTSLRSKAQTMGWTLDATHDLARVLRVPGTINRKVAAEPVDVTIAWRDEPTRYDPSEFPECPTEMTTPAAPQLIPPANVLVPKTSKLDFAKTTTLLQDREIKKAWERKRTTGDTSPSGQDWFLAVGAAKAGWTADEITHLLVGCREQNREDAKHDGYYRNTVARSIDAAAREIAAAEILGNIEELMSLDSLKAEIAGMESGNGQLHKQNGIQNGTTAAASPIIDEEKRKSLLRELSKIVGCDVKEVVRYISKEPEFRLVTPKGNIPLGSFTKVRQQEFFRTAAGVVVGKTPDKFNKKGGWDLVSNMILAVAVETEIGEEATEQGAALAWLRGYLDDNPPGDDKDKCLESKEPFFSHDKLAVNFVEVQLVRWIFTNRNIPVTSKNLGAALREIGCRPFQARIKNSTKKRGTISVWRGCLAAIYPDFPDEDVSVLPTV